MLMIHRSVHASPGTITELKFHSSPLELSQRRSFFTNSKGVASKTSLNRTKATGFRSEQGVLKP